MKPFLKVYYTLRDPSVGDLGCTPLQLEHISPNIFQERHNDGLGRIVQVRHDAVVGVGFNYAFVLSGLRRQDEKSW